MDDLFAGLDLGLDGAAVPPAAAARTPPSRPDKKAPPAPYIGVGAKTKAPMVIPGPSTAKQPTNVVKTPAVPEAPPGPLDEWEQVVAGKTGPGMLLHPVPTTMTRDEVQGVVDAIGGLVGGGMGRVVLLRRREMAHIDIKEESIAEAAYALGGVETSLGTFMIYERTKVFTKDAGAASEQPPPTPPTGALNLPMTTLEPEPSRRSRRGRGSRAGRRRGGGGGAAARVRSLSLSSTETSSSSTDSEGNHISRREKRKARRTAKKEMKNAPPPIPGALPPTMIPPVPVKREEKPRTFLIPATDTAPAECRRCRETLPRDVPRHCPSCEAPLIDVAGVPVMASGEPRRRKRGGRNRRGRGGGGGGDRGHDGGRSRSRSRSMDRGGRERGGHDSRDRDRGYERDPRGYRDRRDPRDRSRSYDRDRDRDRDRGHDRYDDRDRARDYDRDRDHSARRQRRYA